jgi:hypothetical protein
VAVVLVLHWHFFGSPWRAPQPFTFGNPLIGAAGLLLSPSHGILPFAPFLVMSVWGWIRLIRKRLQPELFAVGGAVVLYFGLMACWHSWAGGWCYGPRLVVPVLPFLAVGTLGIMDLIRQGERRTTVALTTLVAVSVVIQLIAIVFYWRAWDRHPLLILVDLLGGVLR